MFRLYHLSFSLLMLIAPAFTMAQEAVFSPTEAEFDSVYRIPYESIRDNPAQQAEVIEKYLEAAKKQGNKKAMAQLLSKLGRATYNTDNIKSIGASLESIKLYEELKDRVALGSEYAELGYRTKRRDLNKAFTYMRTGLRILELAGAREEYGQMVNNFGVLFELQGNADSAIYYYRVSAAIKEETNDSLGISYSYNNIFNLMVAQNRMDSALYYLDRSTEIRKQLGAEMGLTENYLLYGDYYKANGKYNEAVNQYLTALERSRRYGYMFVSEYAAQHASETYELMGRNDEALKYFKISIQYRDSLASEHTNKAIAELEVKFDTQKKEKEIAEQKAALAQNELKIKQRNYLLAGLALVLIFIVIIAYYIYRQQKFRQERLLRENQLKDQIAQITLANKLQDERLRISRDLHDNIGSQLTFIISSLDNLRVALKSADEKTTARIKRINEFTRDIITQLRDTIWAMNKEHITSEDLRERLVNHFAKAEAAQVKLDLKLDTQGELRFTNMVGMNVFRVIQEATNNALKHAKATKIDVSMNRNNGSLKVHIDDNGSGFDVNILSTGHGLVNMRRRVTEIGGKLEIHSEPGKGTKIDITVPVKQNTA